MEWSQGEAEVIGKKLAKHVQKELARQKKGHPILSFFCEVEKHEKAIEGGGMGNTSVKVYRIYIELSA